MLRPLILPLAGGNDKILYMADIKLISKLRAETGVPISDCTAALNESNGDIEKARDILRKKGALKAAVRAGKVAAEGTVVSYIHGGGKIGVLAEVNCETDFVAKTEKFQNLAKEIAMHIAAMSPVFVERAEVPPEIIGKEKEIYKEAALLEGKDGRIVDKIVEGKMEKYFQEVCLLEQPFVKDEDKTVKDLLAQAVAEIGEKVTVRRFARFELGEGIERVGKADFAAEVEAQLKS